MFALRFFEGYSMPRSRACWACRRSMSLSFFTALGSNYRRKFVSYQETSHEQAGPGNHDIANQRFPRTGSTQAANACARTSSAGPGRCGPHAQLRRLSGPHPRIFRPVAIGGPIPALAGSHPRVPGCRRALDQARSGAPPALVAPRPRRPTQFPRYGASPRWPSSPSVSARGSSIVRSARAWADEIHREQRQRYSLRRLGSRHDPNFFR